MYSDRNVTSRPLIVILGIKFLYYSSTIQLWALGCSCILYSCTSYSHVTFRPRSTSVAGTVSNAEGFACCCRVANDEDGYRVGTGQGFEVASVGIGHLSWSATWR